MGRSDHKYFNCSENHEHEYVIRQYHLSNRDDVRKLLKEACADERINNSTHDEVYALIKDTLGYSKE